MKEQLITFETAKLAKEKGFDLILFNNVWLENAEYGLSNFVGNISTDWAEAQNYHNFDNEYEQPTQSLMQRWLRETHKIQVIVLPYEFDVAYVYKYGVALYSNGSSCESIYGTYEEALEQGLFEGLQLVTNQ